MRRPTSITPHVRWTASQSNLCIKTFGFLARQHPTPGVYVPRGALPDNPPHQVDRRLRPIHVGTIDDEARVTLGRCAITAIQLAAGFALPRLSYVDARDAAASLLRAQRLIAELTAASVHPREVFVSYDETKWPDL